MVGTSTPVTIGDLQDQQVIVVPTGLLAGSSITNSVTVMGGTELITKAVRRRNTTTNPGRAGTISPEAITAV